VASYILGVPQVEATYTPQILPFHWSVQGINRLSRDATSAALSAYAKTGKAVMKNPKFPQAQQVDEP